MTFRPATAADVPAVLALWQREASDARSSAMARAFWEATGYAHDRRISRYLRNK